MTALPVVALLLLGALAFRKDAMAAVAKGPLDPTFVRLDPLFRKYANASGVPWQWLKAIAMQESALGQNALVKAGRVSSDGLSWGLMQLRLSTAQDFEPMITVAELNQEETSIRIAARFLAWIRGELVRRGVPASSPRFAELVFKSYNQGARRSAEEYFGGPSYAAAYWAGIQRHLAKIQSLQGGA